MEFTLTYRGSLKANAGPKEKQIIRRAIHRQMQLLWQQPPLAHKSEHEVHSQFAAEHPKPGFISLSQHIGAFRFVPLISPRIYLVAELDITFLRPEAPGAIITQGGDIDNRIKTLLDALRMPKVISELPKGDKPMDNENPFYCLLEDDNLVTRLAVSTDRLLEPIKESSDVQLVIRVEIKRTEGSIENLSLG